ncbi:mycothiol synthase [Cryobacterium frigoriphilum]|uniref:mycothiol synthase n=1 Tax=Cryobacterium frigoriphilum TaxID=1259150 RepID=UPI00141AEBF4|nr:mycothiol synthase [Cryobacterium frigoriphilum]
MLSLTPLSYTDAASAARVHHLATAAQHVDGYAPLNEQALFDLAAGTRDVWIATADVDGVALDTALLVLGGGQLDLVVHPDHRRQGVATAILSQVLDGQGSNGAEAQKTEAVTEPGKAEPVKTEPGKTAPVKIEPVSTAWAHGDHPGARALANRYQFEAARTLLQMRLRLAAAAPASTPQNEVQPGAAPRAAPGVTIGAFHPGSDDAAWVELNALVFAEHAEQGALTLTDLADRQHESWFEADDFLIMRDDSGRMIGYNWLKIEQDLGEIYVIGVHPRAAGQGLGRTLMQAGLARLRERGCTNAALYVEADSLGPVHLYRSLGFTDFTVDVQYLRSTDRRTG